MGYWEELSSERGGALELEAWSLSSTLGHGQLVSQEQSPPDANESCSLPNPLFVPVSWCPNPFHTNLHTPSGLTFLTSCSALV